MGPCVAAGHPATAAAGAEILADGGTAADAAVAASLASCVAETVMTGLLGGGHAIYLDALTGSVENLDFFVTVPGLGEPREARGMVDAPVPFGDVVVHYSIGPESCAVPGVPGGLDALWRRYGRLPWARLVEPAIAIARDGVELPEMHARCLAMLEPVMTMDAGAAIYSPGGRLLEAGGTLRQPGLVGALGALAEEGGASMYSGTLAGSLLGLMDERGGLIAPADLEAFEAVWKAPVETSRSGCRVLTRGGLAGIVETFDRLPTLRGLDEAGRLLAIVEAVEGSGPEVHTTNICVVDAAGSACVLTTSLGLGSGDFLPGFDAHLNSMLGETDLLRGPHGPGDRMQSMMAPLLALDDEGLALAAGAAGGTRLRTALVGVTAAVLDDGVQPQEAVDRPRAHPALEIVNVEPGVSDAAVAALEASGRRVRHWPEIHHYFGGVSAIGPAGAAADPRRNGAVAIP